MLDKQLTMAQVAEKISQNFGEDLFVIWSDDTADKLIIRCRVIRDPKLEEEGDHEEDQILKRVEAHMLESISLRGIPGIAFLAFSDDQIASTKITYLKGHTRIL